MSSEPRYRSTMIDAGLTGADLPDWLLRCIHAHEAAAKEVKSLPGREQAEYLAILAGSDAVISAHVHQFSRDRKESPKADKMKMLKLKAKAVEMLLRQA